MARDDFKTSTKKILGSRAGYTCSFPNCGKITIGPSRLLKNKYVNSGEAAHITAASPNGPRYDQALTSEKRRSEDNGIWMCSYHANLINKDFNSYSVSEIREWKRKHEISVYYKQSGVKTDIGEIVEISISNFGSINTSNVVTLKQRNIIYGDNGLGKTLICDLIASISNNIYNERWRTKWHSGISKFTLKYVKDEEYNFRINLTSDDQLDFFNNDKKLYRLYAPFKIYYFDSWIKIPPFEYKEELSEDENTDIYNKIILEGFKKYLGIEEFQFCTLIEYMRNRDLHLINDIKMENNELRIQIRNGPGYFTFNMLSQGEKELTIIEIAIAIANLSSEFNPTVLIIDFEIYSTLDDKNIAKFFEKLKSGVIKYQVILNYPSLDKRDDWKEYNLINIYENEKKVFVNNIDD